MIVDSSAIVAIIKQEPEAAQFSRAIEAATPCRMSVAGFVEAGMVIDSKGDPMLSRRYDEALRSATIELVQIDETQAHIARAAYRDFGKGSRHPAQLNFGDCFAYALAKTSGEPLLFKGNDFAHTDVTPALPR